MMLSLQFITQLTRLCGNWIYTYQPVTIIIKGCDFETYVVQKQDIVSTLWGFTLRMRHSVDVSDELKPNSPLGHAVDKCLSRVQRASGPLHVKDNFQQHIITKRLLRFIVGGIFQGTIFQPLHFLSLSVYNQVLPFCS